MELKPKITKRLGENIPVSFVKKMGKLKQDKGVAGLTILLSLIVMLFVIGLLVMIFSIMSGKITDSDTLYTTTGAITVGGEAVTQAGLIAGDDLAYKNYRNAKCTIVEVYNNSITGAVISATNYTEVSECTIKNLTSAYSTVNWSVNYTYTYDEDKFGAVGVINDTDNSIAGTTDWFDIFIVIGAMVVLILLTVIIITAIRSSGMVAEGSSGKPRNVGTA